MDKTIKEKQADSFEALSESQGYENPMEVPQLKKVVVTTGIGSITDTEKIQIIPDRLAKITGQKPVPTRAKQSIASFNTRAGDVVGYKVTLRGNRMYSFVDRLIHLTLPRTKDFRGISKDSIDEMGNLTIGVSEHTAFPETSDEELENVFGLGITLVSSAEDKEEAVAYFEQLGIPFKDPEDEEE